MYSKFSENELIEAYKTMLDYSGKATPEILSEIEKRGSLDSFLETIKQNEINKQESNRVLNELIELNRKGYSLDEIKSEIRSELWTKQHLNAFIENRYIRHNLYQNDIAIDKEIILRSFIGCAIASVIGTLLWAFSIILFKAVFYPILIPVYIVSYLIIKGYAGKSRNNLIVFLSCLCATIISFVLGFKILTYL